MITLVRLSNWRAYRDVELQMESGTTFLVAMNGVGKSSLLEAVQWALHPSIEAGCRMDPKGRAHRRGRGGANGRINPDAHQCAASAWAMARSR